jgi:hypothetical protein
MQRRFDTTGVHTADRAVDHATSSPTTSFSMPTTDVCQLHRQQRSPTAAARRLSDWNIIFGFGLPSTTGQ